MKHGGNSGKAPKEEKEKNEETTAHPPSEMDDAFEESSRAEQYAEELQKTLEGARNSGSAAPSILLYTFLNAYQG